MKLLIIAMAHSVHTARWVKQISGQGWVIHLFPSKESKYLHPSLSNVIVHHLIYGGPRRTDVIQKGIYVISTEIASVIKKICIRIYPNYRKLQLKSLINKIKPDIIHSLETQHAGYLVVNVLRKFNGKFPFWIHTNWGSDIYLYGRLQKHIPLIKNVLKNCNYYSCECNRDAKLARNYGYNGKILPIFPNAGGFDLTRAQLLRSQIKTSQRKMIMLKGDQSWSGRSLVGIRALERAKDILTNYELVIYSSRSSIDVEIAAELLANESNIHVKLLPKNTTHDEILTYHGMARISIGVSISDAISTSLLEAMVMGSFPIQSCTSAADEWITDGKTGILVPPEDPEIIEKAIRRALSDDDLVDNASDVNWQIAKERLDYCLLKKKAINFYNVVFEEMRKNEY